MDCIRGDTRRGAADRIEMRGGHKALRGGGMERRGCLNDYTGDGHKEREDPKDCRGGEHEQSRGCPMDCQEEGVAQANGQLKGLHGR